jgi:hypothetical protein
MNHPMKNPLKVIHMPSLCFLRPAALLGMVAGLMLLGHSALAQTTNAIDFASDPAYANDGPPNGLSPGGQNGGTGFGVWTFTVNSSGGAFIQTSGPSGDSFDLWNTGYNANTLAVRPFSSPLSAGQSFSVQLRLNNLDTPNTNMLALEDASGHILFAYYHIGGDNGNGHYMDANTSSGTAVNFPYAYQSFNSFTFTLNSSTSYTFTDNTSGGTVSGVISGGPIAKVAFIRGNGLEAPGNGQDFQFDALQITTTAGPPAPPGFANVNPAAGAFSVPTTNAVGVQIVPGGASIAASGVTLKVDGGTVTPTITTGTGSSLIVNYQPPSPFTAGSAHTVQVVIVDGNHNSFTNAWGFTTAFASLPAVLAGPYTVSNGLDTTIFTAAGDAWLGTNYGTNSSRTIYARASMNVINNAGETGSGGFYCGFHFFDGNTERLLFGNNWPSTNWSVDAKEAGEFDVPPVTPIVTNTWHTMVARIDFVPGQDSSVKVWLDPDFTQTEANQPNAPFETPEINTFDNIRLRCGNGTNAITEFSNVVVAATSAGVGFAAPAAPQFQGIVPLPGAVDVSDATPIDVQVVVGGWPINNSAVALKVDGAAVSPSVSQSAGLITVSYTPAPHLSDGTVHTAQIIVTDSSNTSYTNVWSFTTGFASLPAVLPGPFTTSNSLDIVIFNSGNDAWIGTNYGENSSETLYVRFSMEFNATNDTGLSWGGLDFFQDGNERLLVGKNGGSPNWSVAYNGTDDGDVPPSLAVNTNEWHTFVVRVDYSPGAPATANVWLDPDFTQPEVDQPMSPLTLSIDNTFDNIRLRCGFNGAVDTFSNVVVSAVSVFPPGGPVTFQGFVPGQNASSAPVGSPISVNVIFGTYGVNTNTVVLNLDGTNETPTFAVSPTQIAVNYQSPTPFAPGSAHTVTVSVTDSNGTPYATSWSFTADQYPTLPVTQAGPLDAFTGSDIILYNAQNQWIDSNYGPTSTNTLYTRFSMTFYSLNGETGNGGGFGGLEFYEGTTERLLVGNNWISTNWSTGGANAANGELPNADFQPVTPIVLGEWHTFVIKCAYDGTNDAVEAWMDPDFTKSEYNQPNSPISLTMDNTFDNIHLRAGNGSAQAEFTNLVMAATAPGVGFAPGAAPAVLNLSRVNGSVQLSWTSTGTLLVAPAVTGPWSTDSIQSNPQTITATNSARFFRLQQ